VALTLLLVLLTPRLMGAGGCGGAGSGGEGGSGSGGESASNPWLALSINGIPLAESELLVVPPSGFTIEASFLQPGQVQAGTVRAEAEVWTDGTVVDLSGHAIASGVLGTVFQVPPEESLASGSHTLRVAVTDVGGKERVASRPVAVRPFQDGPPIQGTQTVWLDTGSDRDGDGQPDLIDDLRKFGLYSDGSTSAELFAMAWTQLQIRDRTQAFFADANHSGLPGGDPIAVEVTLWEPEVGSYTRLCIGGDSPNGQPIAGNVLFDPGNANPSDVACDDYLPSGIFPGELTAYAGSSAYQTAFGPFLADPLGTLPIDAVIATPSFDPQDPAQVERMQDLEPAVAVLAQAIATITAHEACHALGLVPPGAPGKGLYGGSSGLEYTHNLAAGGGAPAGPHLMNVGTQLGFAQLSGANDTPVPGLRALNAAYLKGRLVLDAAVTGVFEAPLLDGVSPTEIPFVGSTSVQITLTGAGFYEDGTALPVVSLDGPLYYQVFGTSVVDETTLTGWVLVPMVVPGVYDVVVRNPDGQRAVLPAALAIQ